MANLLQRGKEVSNRVAPVREFFAHAGEMRNLLSALTAADKTRDFVEMAQGYFARSIEERLATFPLRARSQPHNELPWRTPSPVR